MEEPLLNYSPTMLEVRAWFKELKTQEKLDRLLDWGEEQPHLYGFIINLADDFTDEEHEALSFLPLLLTEVFRKTGLRIENVDSATLEKAIHAHSKGKDPEASTLMQQEMVKAWEDLAGMEVNAFQSRPEMTLVSAILISAFELAVTEKLL